MRNNKAFKHRRTYPATLHRVLFLSITLTIVSATIAHAETWYLMAPDEKIASNPRVGDQDGAWAGNGAACVHPA